jgi:hypothetical protein
VLFSKDRVADYVNANFEPAWESVRPVPLVRIDFGNGNVLTRTLHGNILTSVCTADGLVLDALPGIYAEDTYLDRLDQLRLLARYAQAVLGDARVARVQTYHRTQADLLARDQTPARFVQAKRIAPITKMAIEWPMEVVLVSANVAATMASEWPNHAVAPAPAAEPPARNPPAAKEEVTGWRELAEDTRLNESTRRRQIHELLADAGLVRPEKVMRPIYKDVLQADLDDPYLGLGKTLFETYPFAREDATR